MSETPLHSEQRSEIRRWPLWIADPAYGWHVHRGEHFTEQMGVTLVDVVEAEVTDEMVERATGAWVREGNDPDTGSFPRYMRIALEAALSS